MNLRIGQGYDSHRLVEGRALIIGGVTIPYELGLAGHSDADVLLHAIIDALLGALALGNIGAHFPDTDPRFSGANSRQLLRHAYVLVCQKNYQLQNLDCTVIAQAPKLALYLDAMRQHIAQDLTCTLEQISVKAKTNEGMGWIGRGEGIRADAIVLLVRKNNVPK